MYNDNIKLEDISKRNIRFDDDRFKKASVCILGAGGIGSNVANMLVRSCIGNIRIVDFDIVEPSNLNRQIYSINHIGRYKVEALKEILIGINPFVNIDIMVKKVDEDNILDIIGNYDIVVEAFDNAEMKALAVNTILENLSDKYIVSCSGMAGLHSSNDIKTKKVMNRLFLCGDYHSDFEEEDCIMAPRVMMVAGHQANVVLRIVCDLI